MEGFWYSGHAQCTFGLITHSNARLQRLLLPIIIEHASTPSSFGSPLHRPPRAAVSPPVFYLH
uniref:Uncharacterized protein n=1 Tax=Oryza punctata TaxID=4537 RepID=A0A0E0KVM9_ORYPU